MTIFETIEVYRNKNKNAVSNVYAYDLRNAINQMENDGAKLHSTTDGVYVLLPHSDFYQLYYWFNSNNLPENFLPVLDMPVVVEFLERSSSTQHEMFDRAGFLSKSILRRMVFAKNNCYETHPQNIRLASNVDLEVIMRMYNENFDIYVDRIPTYEELSQKILRDELVCVDVNDTVIGFANITVSPGLSMLNHIFMNPHGRGRGYGEGLLNYFLKRAADSKFVKLWVVVNNEYAIKLYEKKGFTFEKLINRVMIK